MDKILGVSLMLVFFAACSDSGIETYQVQKQEPVKPSMQQPVQGSAGGGMAPAQMGSAPMGGGMGSAPMGGGMGSAPMGGGMGSAPAGMELSSPAQASEFTWKAPAGWVEKPGNTMRLASFEINAPAGSAPYLATIVALGGQAGGFAANVNRWRGQVGLPTVDENSIKGIAKSDKGLSGPFSWLIISNDSDPTKSMLVAILNSGDLSVFVKFMAPKEVLLKQQGSFLSLCRSIKRKTAQ